MRNLNDLLPFCRLKSKEFPSLREQIWEFYELTTAELSDECASEAHEVELAYNSINNLIQEYEGKN